MRFEVRTGRKPDVRYICRFGCLCKVLLPLELRKHKFDAYTEDYVYAWTVSGRGRDSFPAVEHEGDYIVRKDVVVKRKRRTKSAS